MKKRLLIGLVSGALALTLVLPGMTIAKDKGTKVTGSGYQSADGVFAFFVKATGGPEQATGYLRMEPANHVHEVDVDCLAVDGIDVVVGGEYYTPLPSSYEAHQGYLLAQWDFYVVAADAIRRSGHRSGGLAWVQSLATGPAASGDLRAAVTRAVRT